MKKKTIIILIIAIILVIGGSFAYWRVSLVETSTNNIATSCFDLSLSDSNAINLQSAFPITDAEGKTLTPYEFTITNNCATYAYYEVNLEVLNNTNLDSNFIKVELDDETPVLLSSKTVTTTTLSNATTSYKLKKAYMNASESKTYHLRLWIDENVTLADNITEKEFSGKITIRATYKPEAASSQEECELEYGEGAAACSLLADYTGNSEDCLNLHDNGSLDYLYYSNNNIRIIRGTNNPITCKIEDDYGESYYFRGNHQDINVKFADSCWKIIRVTGDGSIKIMYNGDLDANNTCTTTSGNHEGVSMQTLSLSGNKVYGNYYTFDGSTYTLTDTSTMNWSEESNNIIGKYTCGNTNSSCTSLYYVASFYNDMNAYTIKTGSNVNYASVANNYFNSSRSPAYVGYMYDDVYLYQQENLALDKTLLSESESNSSNYYYGDTISYSGGYYYITNQDGSNVTQLSWGDNYTSLPGKYTCRGTSTYNATTLRCTTAYKVLDTTTKANYMISEYLYGGVTSIGKIKVAPSYTKSGDSYVLNNHVELSPIEWYTDYNNYVDYYVCSDYNQIICDDLQQIKVATKTNLSGLIGISNNYFYGTNFTYDENAEHPYTLTNAVQFYDISNEENRQKINTHHYTCFSNVDNKCDKLYFIFEDAASFSLKEFPHMFNYIELKENEDINSALDNMLTGENVNINDSYAKMIVDGWYAMKLKNTNYESYLSDTIFCNDRTISDYAGWNENGDISRQLKFNAGDDTFFLKCPSKRDAFTVNDATNGNGALTYPIGIISIAEASLYGNSSPRISNYQYFTLTPSKYEFYNSFMRYVGSDGYANSEMRTDKWAGIRPVIALKPSTKFISGGDGTASNPYEVDMSASVN